MCEDCSRKHASFGLASDRKIRWCGTCGKQRSAINLGAKMCESCGLKQANFGHMDEPKRKRWCKSCGKANNAVSLTGNRKMCEDCNSKRPHFGTKGERRARWCGACGAAHDAVRVDAQKMCENCGKKQTSYGMAEERKRRWCAGCGTARGAIYLSASTATSRPRELQWHGQQPATQQRGVQPHALGHAIIFHEVNTYVLICPAGFRGLLNFRLRFKTISDEPPQPAESTRTRRGSTAPLATIVGHRSGGTATQTPSV
jgi:hypothetical protein